jgi:hypothetical protein
MLLAMPGVVLKVIALVFQRIAGLVCDLPPGSSSPHTMIHGARAHAKVRHPPAVLDCVIVSLPVLDDIAPHVRIRRIERHVIDKAKAMDNPGGAVVSLLSGDAPGVLRRLHLLEQRGMIAFFDAENRVKPMILQGLNMRGVGTQALFGDNTLEVRMVLTQLGNEALGGLPFTIIVVRPIVLHNRFRHQGHHGAHVWMDNRRASHLMMIRHAPVAVDLVQTRCTVHRRGGKIPRPIERQQGAVIEKHHRFERFAALELPKDAREHRAEPRGGDRVKDVAHVRVARDPLHAIDGVHIALGPFLVKGQERGRLQRKHGTSGHECVSQCNVHIVRTIIWEGGEAASHQTQERIGREMLAPFGGNDRHGNPRHKDIKSFQ